LSTREFLVSKFVCHECGNILKVGYLQKEERAKRRINDLAQGEPTGSSMVENTIYVLPCEKCKERADKISEALKTLLKEIEK
jgi:transcriptional regulator of met regulon